MKKLLVVIVCLSAAVFSYAQEQEVAPAPSPEQDVIYFKDGSQLRGEIVGGTKTLGRIQARDGNVFVYRKKNIKMLQKEPVSLPSAKEDSLKVVNIAKKVIEDDKEQQRQEEARRKYEEELLKAQLRMDPAYGKDKEKEKKAKESAGFLMYSTIEALGGVGLGKLPLAENDTMPAFDNKQRMVGFQYAIGGRTDFFAIGFNVGFHQTYRNISPVAAAMRDTLPTTLLALPVGVDLRIEFARQTAAMAPYIGLSGGYAISLTDGVPSYMVVNPSFGFRFGRKVSSLFSMGLQLNMEGGRTTKYATMRLGFIF